MGLDPSILSNFLLAFTIFAGTLTAKYSTQSRAQRRLIKRLREENEALWDDRYKLRRAMANKGVPLPETNPVLKRLQMDEEDK